MEFKPYWISVWATPLILRWLLTHAQTSKARRKGDAVIFRSTGFVAIYGVSCVLALAMVIGGWNQDARTLTTVTGTIWLLSILLLWPATIVLDAKGITSRHIWRPTRVIPFSEVDYATRTAEAETIIYGKGSLPEIKVSQYHDGSDELKAELRKHHVTYY
jgi:fatty acid desaturase